MGESGRSALVALGHEQSLNILLNLLLNVLAPGPWPTLIGHNLGHFAVRSAQEGLQFDSEQEESE